MKTFLFVLFFTVSCAALTREEIKQQENTSREGRHGEIARLKNYLKNKDPSTMDPDLVKLLKVLFIKIPEPVQ